MTEGENEKLITKTIFCYNRISLPQPRTYVRDSSLVRGSLEKTKPAAKEGESVKEYNKSNIPLAKALRKNMTPWERKLWYEFLRSYPVRFQRQKAIGDYIVDFYCAKARLVIELDGGGHYELKQTQKDNERTKALQFINLKVLRVCNLDIDRNFEGTCEMIDNIVRASLSQPRT